MWTRMNLWLPVLLALSVGFWACATESAGPVIGSAEWYWEAAQHNYAIADYEKTQQHLKNLIDAYPEWRPRALPWQLMVTGGLARGYLELTDTFGLCASANQQAAPELQNPIQQWRRDARRHALNFAESVGTLQDLASSQTMFTLDFAFPAGLYMKSPMMANIESGAPPRPDQIVSCESEALGRGLVLQTSAMVDPEGDIPNAQAAFDASPVQVQSEKLLCSMAGSLVDLSTVFDFRHVNEADKQLFLLDLAVETLKGPLASEDSETRERAEQVKKQALAARQKVT